MNQKQIEQTRVIAEKDGWKIVKRLPVAYGGGDPAVKLITEKRAVNLYLTDLNALHKVAMDVMGEIALMQFEAETVVSNCKLYDEALLKKQELEMFKIPFNGIHSALTKRPINGEYIDLFNAVYDGIVFLNENKTEAK